MKNVRLLHTARQARFAAGVPELLPTFATRTTNKRPRNTSPGPSGPTTIYEKSRIYNKVQRDVEPAPLPALTIAPQHRTLAEAAPALTPTSTTRTTNSKYGGSREFDEDDSGSGTGHARSGWICGWLVSLSCSA
jgi:hypothetical protein